MFKLLRDSCAQGRVSLRQSTFTSSSFSARKFASLLQFSQSLHQPEKRTRIRWKRDVASLVDQAAPTPLQENGNMAELMPKRQPTSTLCVIRVGEKVTKRELITAFQKFGTLANVVLPVGADGKNKGVGWVKFENLTNAIQCHDAFRQVATDVEGREITVEHLWSENSNTRKLYFQAFPESKRVLENMLDKWKKDITYIKFFHEFGHRTDAGLICFKSAEAAADVLKNMAGAKTRVGTALQIRFDLNDLEPSSTLSVAHLPGDVERRKLVSAFGKFGEVSKIILPKKKRNSSFNFAYVSFSNIEDATTCYEACSVEPMTLHGRKVEVAYTRIPDWTMIEFHGIGERKEEVMRMLRKWEKDIKRLEYKSPVGPTGVVYFRSPEAATDALVNMAGTRLPQSKKTLNLRFVEEGSLKVTGRYRRWCQTQESREVGD